MLDIGKEVFAILLGLETDEVVGQHRLDQLAMMRHAADQRARRPWRMQEEADRLRHAEIAQLRAERQEMIVLHPEHGIGLAEAHQRARHEGVHFAIGDDSLPASRGSGRRANAAPATAPNWQSLRNSRRNAPRADRAWPARRRPATRFRQRVPSGSRRGRDRDEPTQIAPEFSTTGSNAAASPPVMGSLGFPRATRFETTTRFTGPLLLRPSR